MDKPASNEQLSMFSWLTKCIRCLRGNRSPFEMFLHKHTACYLGNLLLVYIFYLVVIRTFIKIYIGIMGHRGREASQHASQEVCGVRTSIFRAQRTIRYCLLLTTTYWVDSPHPRSPGCEVSPPPRNTSQ